MEIIQLITGIFETNTYLLKENNDYIVIDPSGKAQKIVNHIDGNLCAILLTHGHFDHIKAVDDLYNIYNSPIYIFKEDKDLIDHQKSKLFNKLGPYSAYIKSPVNYLKEGHYKINNFNFDVYKTSGHTEGSCIFKFNNILFTGDTLFKESVGRTDLYGGNENKLKDSLKIFKIFDIDTIIKPGHGEESTLEHEFIFNPFFKLRHIF